VPAFPLELEAAVELVDVLDEVEDALDEVDDALDDVDDVDDALEATVEPPVAPLLAVDPPDPLLPLLLVVAAVDPPDPPVEVVEPPVLPTEAVAVDPPVPATPLETLEVPPPRPFPDVDELLHPPGSVAKATTPRSALATPARLTAALFIFSSSLHGGCRAVILRGSPGGPAREGRGRLVSGDQHMQSVYATQAFIAIDQNGLPSATGDEGAEWNRPVFRSSVFRALRVSWNPGQEYFNCVPAH
jgi:hypothetical protein